MAQASSLKLSINLNRGISSTSENSRQINVEERHDDADSDFASEEDNRERSRPNSSLSVSSNISSKSNDESCNSIRNEQGPIQSNLLNVNVPTATKRAQKRKHIQTNFDDEILLNKTALDAQRKEKERLERLERLKQTVDQNDHISQMAALLPNNGNIAPLPIIDATDPDVVCLIGECLEFDSKQKGTSKQEAQKIQPSSSTSINHEIIELSSGEEDLDDVTEVSSFVPYRVPPKLPAKRNRWITTDKDKINQEKMEEQYKIEQLRLRRRRKSGDLEKVDLTEGRLLVNAGHPASDPDIHVATHLTHTLQPHQLGGVRFMYDNVIESIDEFRSSQGFGCILAHSMGLGKTIQIITFTEIFIRTTHCRKVLIIVPINTIQNWFNEFDKWMPRYSESGEPIRHFDVFLLGDSVKTFDQRVNLLETWSNQGGVLLIGYDMFRMLVRATQPKKPTRPKLNFLNGTRVDRSEKPDDFDQGFTAEGRVKKEANSIIRLALLNPGPDLVICDEGHKIKNLNTDISLALGSIRTRRRIVLTGYPLQNNLMEYYCMVDFVRPEYLGTRKSFSIQFEKPIKNGQCIDSTPGDVKIARQRTHILGNMLKGFVQRRTHHLLKTILPESKEFVILLRKSPLQHMLYRNFVLYANNEIKAGNSNVFNPLKAFSACSKIWNHPDVLARTLERKREEKKKIEKEKAKRNAESTVHVASTVNGTMGSVPWNNNYFDRFANQTSSQQNINDALNGTNNIGKVTHHDLWGGIFGGMSNQASNISLDSVDSTDQEDDLASGFNTVNGKPRRGRAKKNLGTALLEELDMADQGLQYDWADIAMGNYKTGNIENGYKIAIAMSLLDETTKIGEKMLIFSQNLTALSLIEEYLDRRKLITAQGEYNWQKNRNYFRLDGSTNGSEREKLINRFNSDGNVYLFLISTRAGSLGINLVSANRCIILDACWNPCHDAQAVCRVYRYGQQRRTYIYRLIMDNCMEKAIFNRQISKHGLQQRVVDDAQVDANITQKELETLLMYDENLDVVQDKWDTSLWHMDDSVLEEVAKRHSNMIAGEPFLHESLMLEREEGLSEQEKLEAQLLFEREKAEEIYGDARIDQLEHGHMMQPNSLIPRGVPRWAAQTFNFPHLDPPALRATPMPHHLDMVTSGQFRGGLVNNLSMMNGNLNMDGGIGLGLPYMGSMFPGMERQMGMRPDYIPSPVAAFPGAAIAYEPCTNSNGSVQRIRTDRPMSLPVISNPGQTLDVPMDTEAMLVRTGSGIYLRLANGVILDAKNTIFSTYALPMLMNSGHFSQFRPTSQFNGPNDVIELD